MITIQDRTGTIREIRGALTDLIELGAVQSLQSPEASLLKETVSALEDPFLIVVVGEFNSGKSTLINALLGQEVSAEGITPTTAMIYLIRYGEKLTRTSLSDWGELVTLPSEPLRTLSIVDTPGTNSVFTDHAVLTNNFFPRADTVLFITSADRPYTESERKFLDSIRDWGKKTVLVINKIDLLSSESEQNRIVEFVSEQVRRDFHSEFPIFPISARAMKKALHANGADRTALIEASGFPALAEYLRGTLSDAVRFQLKMDSAISQGLKISSNLIRETENELAIYRDDLALVESIEAIADGYESDFDKDIRRTIREVRIIFDEIRRGADEYFDDLFHVKNIPNILRREKIQNEFQDRVLKNLPVAVERLTNDIVTEIYQRQSTTASQIADRIAQREDPTPAFNGESEALTERTGVLKRLQSAIDELNDQLDREVAVEIGMKHVQTAVRTALAIEVSAIGVGAALTIAATTLATDLLGIFAAVWVAVAGFAVLPYYRKKSQKEFRLKLSTVEENLVSSLEKSLRDEVAGLARRMKSLIIPLKDFDRSKIALKSAQADKLRTTQQTLTSIRERLR